MPPISDEAKERNNKLPGMGGVFNAINMDAYQYAGQNPVMMVDPDGNAFIHETIWGWYEYKAETRSNRLSRWWRLQIPFKGDKEYSEFLKSNNLIDLNDEKSLGYIIGKTGRTVGNLKWLSFFKNKFSSYAKFWKVAGTIGWVVTGLDLGIEMGSAIDEAELIIDGLNLLDGYDRDYIIENATGIENVIHNLIDRGDVTVEYKNGEMIISDDFNYLGDLKSIIQDDYRIWKSNNDASKD